MELKEKARQLPDSPGVYIMKNSSDEIIYVGKAVSLRKRVGSYFSGRDKDPKQRALLEAVADLYFVTTATEAEALILEAGLIKEHHPRYNIAIRDDKAYPLLKLTINEQFPRLMIARRKKDDKALYFGPYTSSRLLRQALDLLRRLFPLRTCRVMPPTLCLNFHIKQCPGPCVGKVSRDDYREVVDDLILFLRGRKQELIKKLSQRMEQAASDRNFEQAALLRDQIISLSAVTERRKLFRIEERIEQLRQALRLKHPPEVVEAFDISNLSGAQAVGSMVRFKNGLPEKSAYRRFRIKDVSGIDDYAMLREVLGRRYSAEGLKRLAAPDLILIDGGKGHLSSALETLSEMGVDLPVISLAKRYEHVYVTWQEGPLALEQGSGARLLLMRIRDEAHRFAIAYHRTLRKKRMLLSELDGIPGVGKKRRMILLKELKNINASRNLTVKQLTQIKGIDEKTAKNIIEHWKRY